MKKILALVFVIAVVVSACIVPTYSLYTNSVEIGSGTLNSIQCDTTDPLFAIRALSNTLNPESETYVEVAALLESGDPQYLTPNGSLSNAPYDYFINRAVGQSLNSSGVNYGVPITNALYSLGYFETRQGTWRIYKGKNTDQTIYFNVFYTTTNISTLAQGDVIPLVYRYSEQTGNPRWASTSQATVSADGSGNPTINVGKLNATDWIEIEE